LSDLAETLQRLAICGSDAFYLSLSPPHPHTNWPGATRFRLGPQYTLSLHPHSFFRFATVLVPRRPNARQCSNYLISCAPPSVLNFPLGWSRRLSDPVRGPSECIVSRRVSLLLIGFGISSTIFLAGCVGVRYHDGVDISCSCPSGFNPRSTTPHPNRSKFELGS